jgi:hypothetical protein
MNEIMTNAIAEAMGDKIVNTIKWSEGEITGWCMLSSGTVAVETSGCITDEIFKESA